MSSHQPAGVSSDFFRQPLIDMINPKDPLVRLAAVIDLDEIGQSFGAHFESRFGRPALYSRLVAGLLYLQDAYDWSDEAVINRDRAVQGLPLLNHKRVYRIMAQNGMLLTRHSGKRPERPHEGKVVTLHSNTRWASDGFEIPFWDRSVVRVTFVIDTCDREIIAWEATTGGFTGETARNLMVVALENRFGSRLPPQPIQWLTDNGSAYTARETVAFAELLGLVPCFTPVRSPESNGMAESFVKTFKRDYVYVHDRPDAKTVLTQLSNWFDDYNEYHPHKGLRMKSPREFIRAQQAAVCSI